MNHDSIYFSNMAKSAWKWDCRYFWKGTFKGKSFFLCKFRLNSLFILCMNWNYMKNHTLKYKNENSFLSNFQSSQTVLIPHQVYFSNHSIIFLLKKLKFENSNNKAHICKIWYKSCERIRSTSKRSSMLDLIKVFFPLFFEFGKKSLKCI